MAHYLTQNERFHIFSKSPIDTKTTINQAVNKSGHTVTLSDVWADDIPWFTEVSGEQDAIARAADASYNDLILWGNDIYKRKGDKTNGASTGTTFEDLWEKHVDLTAARKDALAISEGLYSPDTVENYSPNTVEDEKIRRTVGIKNSQDKVVLNYHVGQPINLLTIENNAKQSSNWAARMFFNGKPVEQFVSSTDKVFAGFPSVGYNVLVYTTTKKSDNYTKITEGELNDNFVNNSFAGIIQFNKERNKTHIFAASLFEYVGDTLHEALGTTLHDVGVSYQVLQTLPDPGVDYKGVVALIKDPTFEDEAMSGSYIEYLCVSSTVGDKTTYSWEKIGTTKADLKNYLRGVKVNDTVAPFVSTDGYSILGSYAESVIYNNLAAEYPKNEKDEYIYPTDKYGKTQRWQEFTSDDIPNYKSISVGISKTGEIAVGVKTATDEVYGLSKMFTGDLSSTSSTTDAEDTAVSVKSTQAMYSSLASSITSLTGDNSKYATKEYVEQKANESNITYSKNSLVDESGFSNKGISLKKGYIGETGSVIKDENGNFDTNVDPSKIYGDYFTIASESALFDESTKSFTNTGYFVTGNEAEKFVTSKFAVLQGELQNLAIDYRVVDKLPDIGEKGIVYLVKDKTADDVYVQYIYQNDEYIEIGTTEIDFSQYMSREDVLAKIVRFFKNMRFKFEGCPSVQFYGSGFIDLNGNPTTDNTKIEDYDGVRLTGASYSAGFKDGEFPSAFYYTTGNEVSAAIDYAINKSYSVGIKYVTAESVEAILASDSRRMDIIYLVKNENGRGYSEWKWMYDSDIHYDGQITSEIKLICLGESTMPVLDDYALKSEIGIQIEDEFGFGKTTNEIAKKLKFYGNQVIACRDTFNEEQINLYIGEIKQHPQMQLGYTNYDTSFISGYLRTAANDDQNLPIYNLPIRLSEDDENKYTTYNNGDYYVSCHTTTTSNFRLRGATTTQTNKISINNTNTRLKAAIRQRSIGADGKLKIKVLDEITSLTINDEINGATSSVGGNWNGVSEKKAIRMQLTNVMYHGEYAFTDGYAPNTVSFECLITTDISKVLSKGGEWEITITALEVEGEGKEEKETQINSFGWFSRTFFYIPIPETTSFNKDTPELKLTTETSFYLSGDKITNASGATYTVTYDGMTGITYGATKFEEKRGELEISGPAKFNNNTKTFNILGSVDDTSASEIKGGSTTLKVEYATKTSDSGVKKIKVSQKALGIDWSDVDTTEQLDVYVLYKEKDTDEVLGNNGDTNTKSALMQEIVYEKDSEGNYKKDSEGKWVQDKKLSRILGYMDDNYDLILSESSYDSTEKIVDNTSENSVYYNKQAKLYNGQIKHGVSSDNGSRYYVRKFVLGDENKKDQLRSFKITIPGITSIDVKDAPIEAWMFIDKATYKDGNKITNGRRMNLNKNTPSGNGTFGTGKSINGNIITVENPLESYYNESLYLVLKLKPNAQTQKGTIEFN